MTRRELILAHLQEHPWATSGDLGLALGLRGGTRTTIRPLLLDMRNKGQLVSADRWAPLMGRNVSTWNIAPPGTKPTKIKIENRELQRRRERNRESKRRSRAKAAEAAPAGRSFAREALPSATPMPDFRKAACLGTDPELFFSMAEDDIEQARALCLACPVRLACAQWADNNGEQYGIWAGQDRSARRLQVAS
jgi:WhiB family redox-sensing transcriptional regulator